MKNKYAGVVVLYNPENDVVDNINSYVENLTDIYIIDNSKYDIFKKKISHLKCQDKIHYIHCDKNIGVGPALNLGAKLARERGYKFLLTMDQDSSFSNISSMIDYIDQDKEVDRTGIYSPFHEIGTRVREKDDVTYEKVLMTSGNIVNLNIYFDVGATEELYYIDCADHDLCMKVNEGGYYVKRLNFCTLFHELGSNTIIINNKEITNHSPFRRYYMTRNNLYFFERHIIKSPLYTLKYFKGFLGNSLSCIRYENQKLEKLKFMCLGVWHYLIRKKGAL